MVDPSPIIRDICANLEKGFAENLSFAAPEITQQWKPNQCHANVASWVADHPGDRAVLGWIITSGVTAALHSVVDSGGQLIDITPRLSPDMHRPLRFVREHRPVGDLPTELILLTSDEWPFPNTSVD